MGVNFSEGNLMRDIEQRVAAAGLFWFAVGFIVGALFAIAFIIEMPL